MASARVPGGELLELCFGCKQVAHLVEQSDESLPCVGLVGQQVSLVAGKIGRRLQVADDLGFVG